MAVELVRVDDRLIHGQVMTSWLHQTQANVIFVIDDVTYADSFLSMVIQTMVPSNIQTVIASVEKSMEAYQSLNMNDRIIILTKTPQPYLHLLHHGVRFDVINIGGMGINKERKTIYKNISASEKELDMLRELMDAGTQVVIQMVAENPAIDLKTILK